MSQFFIGNSNIQVTAIGPQYNAVNPQPAGAVIDPSPGTFVSTTQTGAPSNSLVTQSIGGSGVGSSGVLIANPA